MIKLNVTHKDIIKVNNIICDDLISRSEKQDVICQFIKKADINDELIEYLNAKGIQEFEFYNYPPEAQYEAIINMMFFYDI